MTLPLISGSVFPALWAINLGLVLPLTIACLVLVIVIPSAARRGKLNVPVYALIMFGAAIVAFITGKVVGEPSIRGTVLGMVMSLIFFLLVATAVGCFFGMFFYRQPTDDTDPDHSNKEEVPTVPALDKDRS